MTCCCSSFGGAAERQFTQKKAAQELSDIAEKGPGPMTRLLQDGLLSAKTVDGVLLDIGCGIRIPDVRLLQAGVTRAVAVDALSAYLAAATQEAGRRGVADAIRFVHGDFVTVAAEVPFASVVTLTGSCAVPRRMSCFWMRRSATRSAASRFPIHVTSCLPRRRRALENGGRRLMRNLFRTFVHPAGGMGDVIANAGFELVSQRETFTWAADVVRATPSQRQLTMVLAAPASAARASTPRTACPLRRARRSLRTRPARDDVGFTCSPAGRDVLDGLAHEHQSARRRFWLRRSDSRILQRETAEARGACGRGRS